MLIAFQMRREARVDRHAAGKLVDMAAEHGKATDHLLERAVADMKSGKSSGEITLVPAPLPVPRPHAPRGCGAIIVAGGVAALGLVADSHATAADAMRADGEAIALDWWAAQQDGSP